MSNLITKFFELFNHKPQEWYDYDAYIRNEKELKHLEYRMSLLNAQHPR